MPGGLRARGRTWVAILRHNTRSVSSKQMKTLYLGLTLLVGCGARTSLSDSIANRTAPDDASVNLVALSGCESRGSVPLANRLPDVTLFSTNRCGDVGFYDSVNHRVGILRAGEEASATVRVDGDVTRLSVSADGEYLFFIGSQSQLVLFDRKASGTRMLEANPWPVAIGWLAVGAKPHYWIRREGPESPDLSVYDVTSDARAASLTANRTPMFSSSGDWLFVPGDNTSDTTSTLLTASLGWKSSAVTSERPVATERQSVSTEWRQPTGVGRWLIAQHTLREPCGDTFCERAYNVQAVDTKTAKSITRKYDGISPGALSRRTRELTLGAIAHNVDFKTAWLFDENGNETTIQGTVLDGAANGGRWLVQRGEAVLVLDTASTVIKDLGRVVATKLSRDGRYAVTTRYAGCTRRGNSCINQYSEVSLINLIDNISPRTLGWFEGAITSHWVSDSGHALVYGTRFVSPPSETVAPPVERARFLIDANGAVLGRWNDDRGVFLATASDGAAFLSARFDAGRTTIARTRPGIGETEIASDPMGQAPTFEIAPKNKDGVSNAVIAIEVGDKRRAFNVWTGVPSL